MNLERLYALQKRIITYSLKTTRINLNQIMLDFLTLKAYIQEKTEKNVKICVIAILKLLQFKNQ